MRQVMHLMRDGWQEVKDVVRSTEPGTHFDLRNRILFIATLTAVVDVIASVAVFLLERDAVGTEITNFGDSLFWVTTQLLTVSSQLHNPISTGARVIDVFLQAYAISVVAALAGSFAAFFHRRSTERHGAATKESGT